MKSFYTGKYAVLATKHAKEKVLKRPFLAGLGLHISVPTNLDTDVLGTFTGEIPRLGTMEETVLRKAKLGLDALNYPVAIANEGSFGPHPANPFIGSDYEMMAFVDNERQFHLIESLLTPKTNFRSIEVKSYQELEQFLAQVGFPEHALIVRPKGILKPEFIYKGITKHRELANTIADCVYHSPEHKAHIETDMRAHLNPTRRQVIRKLAFKLVRRLNTFCKACHLPGWGLIKTEKGLPCEACEAPTELVQFEVYGCVKCDYKIKRARSDEKILADACFCPYCNP